MTSPGHLATALLNGPDTTAADRGIAIYDAIMAEINPELLSTVYRTIDERYPDETLPQFAARLEQYRLDFLTFRRCLQAYESTLARQAQSHDRALRVAAETQTKAEEEIFQTGLLNDIAHS